MGRCYEYIKGAHHRDDIAPLTNKEIYEKLQHGSPCAKFTIWGYPYAYNTGIPGTPCVGNLPKGYIQNVPLPRVPRDQSTFQSRVPPVHTIPRYYKKAHVIPTYNSTCRIGERVA